MFRNYSQISNEDFMTNSQTSKFGHSKYKQNKNKNY